MESQNDYKSPCQNSSSSSFKISLSDITNAHILLNKETHIEEIIDQVRNNRKRSVQGMDEKIAGTGAYK